MPQLAKRAGMTVIGSVSSEEKAAFAREQGIDHAVFYRREDVVARVREEIGDLFRRRRKPRDVERRAADERTRVGFGRRSQPVFFQSREDEPVQEGEDAGGGRPKAKRKRK